MRTQQGSGDSAGRPRAWQRWALNIGATLGTLCLLMALCMFAFGLKPLIFASGSMGPEIPTGSLGLAVPVAMSEIVPGEIVSVLNSEGTRVTHRVVENGPSGLILKGDANPVEDLQPYVVETADQLLLSVPLLGYVISWFSQPWAFFVGGLLCAYLLYLAFGKRDFNSTSGTGDEKQRTGKRARNSKVSRQTDKAKRSFTCSVCLALIFSTTSLATLTLPKVESTQAAFNGIAVATTSPIRAGTLSSVPAPLTCKTTGGFLGAATSAEISWTAPSMPSGSRFAVRVETNQNVVKFLNLDSATKKVTFSPSLSLLGGIFGSAQTFKIRVLVVTTKDGAAVTEDGSNIGWSSPIADAQQQLIKYSPGILVLDSYSCV